MAGFDAQIFDSVEVLRVFHRHNEGIAFLEKWNRFEAVLHFAVDEVFGFLRGLGFVKIDKGHAQGFGFGGGEIGFGHLHFARDLFGLNRIALRIFPDARGLFFGNLVLFDEQLQHSLHVLGRGRVKRHRKPLRGEPSNQARPNALYG